MVSTMIGTQSTLWDRPERHGAVTPMTEQLESTTQDERNKVLAWLEANTEPVESVESSNSTQEMFEDWRQDHPDEHWSEVGADPSWWWERGIIADQVIFNALMRRRPLSGAAVPEDSAALLGIPPGIMPAAPRPRYHRCVATARQIASTTTGSPEASQGVLQEGRRRSPREHRTRLRTSCNASRTGGGSLSSRSPCPSWLSASCTARLSRVDGVFGHDRPQNASVGAQ